MAARLKKYIPSFILLVALVLCPLVVRAAQINASGLLGEPNYTTSVANDNQGSINAQGFNGILSATLDTVNHRLFVADTNANDRILVFPLDNSNNITTTTAQYVLGACNFTTAGTGAVTSSTFAFANVVYDSTNARLFVSDAHRRRILAFNVATSTIANCEGATFVLGQTSFTASVAATSQSGLNNTDDIDYDAVNSRLFVADENNNRVMAFSVPGNATSGINGENALFELGQTNFTSSTPTSTQSGLHTPTVESYDPVNSRLFVSDFTNSRVMAFSVPGNATSGINGENAIFELGQANFTAHSPSLTQSGLFAPDDNNYDSTGNRLFVSDNDGSTSGNNRIMIFSVPSNATSGINNENAQNNIGQTGWNTNASGTTQNTFTTIESPHAYDPGNNRIYLYEGQLYRILQINMIHITTASLASGTLGTSYSAAINVTSTQGTSQSYSLLSGSLPSGLSFSTSTGVISGTPTATTTTSLTIEADDNFTTGPFFDRATYSFEIDSAPQAVLSVTTSTALSYTASVGATATSSQSVSVGNTGPLGTTLNWSATSTQSWLTFNPASGSLASAATTSVAFVANPTGLGVGLYNATATIADPAASSSPISLSVSLTISSTGVGVSITAPTNGATVSSTIYVTANPTSTVGIVSVQFLLDGAPLGAAVTSSPYTVSWNTASSTDGSHTLMASTTDMNSNVATSSAITVTVDNTPPILSNGSPSGTLSFGTTSTILSLTTNENATCKYATSSGVSYASMANTFTTTGGTSQSSTISGLTNGSTYHYYVRCLDAVGNVDTSDYTISFAIGTDTTPPSVVITAPPNGASVSSTITLTASSTDNVAVSNVAFYQGIISTSTLIGSSSIPSGTLYSVSWNTGALANGAVTLIALSTDSSTNTSTATTSVTVANPAILSVTTSTSLSYSASMGATATSSQSVNVQNTGPGGTTLNWSATSTQSWLTFSPTSSSLASNASTSVLFIANPTGLGAGTYNATATIADVAATGSPRTFSVTLTVNATGIAVSITAPTNGATVSTTISVTANPTSTVGISSVQFLLDGVKLGSVVTSSPYTISWNTASSTDGSHTLMASTTDMNSNVATSSAITVTVDNTPPILSNGSPTSTLPLGTTSTILSLTTNENATCRYATSSGIAYAAMTNTFTTTGATAQSSTISGLTNGSTYHYYVRCKDAVGNINTSDYAISFAVGSDTTPPSVIIVLPLNGASVSSTVTLTASSTDNVAVASVAFYNGSISPSNLIGSTSTASGTLYSVPWDTTGVTNGAVTLVALSTDTSNNTSTATTTVTVANPVAPTSTTPTTISVSVGAGNSGFSGFVSVAIQNPTPGALVSGTITISGTTSANSQVASFYFTIDGGRIGNVLTAPPYTLSFDTSGLKNGLHEIQAFAVNQFNNVAASNPVPITVGSVAVAAPTSSATSVATSTKFVRYLTLGSTGYDVLALQILLNRLGLTLGAAGAGSPGNETHYFGPRTQSAVQRLQAKYGIVSSGSPFTTGYGAVGPKTRALLNTLAQD